jgi:hypothetical protein
MKIAQIAPLYEAVPPRLYGGTERIVAHLTNAPVELRHEVRRCAFENLVHEVGGPSIKVEKVGTIAEQTAGGGEFGKADRRKPGLRHHRHPSAEEPATESQAGAAGDLDGRD